MKHKTLAEFLTTHPQSNGRIKNWIQNESKFEKMSLPEFLNDFGPHQLLKYNGIGKKTCDDIVSIFKAENLIPDDSEIENLPGRIKNILIQERLTTRTAVRNAICQGNLNPRRIRNYGKRCHKVLCEWAKVNNLEIEKLPERVKNILIRQGLTTRKTIRNAILQGELHPNKIGNYGWESHRLLCEWARTN